MKATTQLVLRVSIGLMLFATAAGKLLDVPGFARILSSYRALPEWSVPAVAFAIPIAELALSVWLFSGRRIAGAALTSAALHALYASWSAAAVLRSLKLPNCGCFGVFLARPLGWSTVVEDLAIVALSLWLLAAARGKSVMFAAWLALPAAIPAELLFEPWFQEYGVTVSIARVSDGPPWVRGVAELPVGADVVFGIVTDYAHYLDLMSPVVRDVTVLEKGPESVRLHFVWRYPFPFRDRDAVVAYRHEKLPDGTFRISWRDAARPTDPGRGVRIRHVAGETRIQPLGAGRCGVTYTYLADLEGRFPRAAEEKAWRKEPVGYILALRRRLGLPMPPKSSAASSFPAGPRRIGMRALHPDVAGP